MSQDIGTTTGQRTCIDHACNCGGWKRLEAERCEDCQRKHRPEQPLQEGGA